MITPGATTLEMLPPPPAGKTGWPWTVAAPPLEPAPEVGGSWPRITIVTPSYQQAEFIEATLRSVLLQGYSNLEYIVLDGGSTDGSVEIIRKYEPWLSDWTSGPDNGQTAVINTGFAAATGDLLHWLNSDDVLLPGALEHMVELSRRHPDAPAWVAACHRIDPAGRILSTIFPKALDRDGIADWPENYFYQPSCFIAASAWREVGPMDEDIEYVFDFDLWLRLAELGPLVGSEEVISAATIHERAKSQAQRGALFEEMYQVQSRHGFEHLARATQARKRERRPPPQSLYRRVKRLAWRMARRLGVPTGSYLRDWVQENKVP